MRRAESNAEARRSRCLDERNAPQTLHWVKVNGESVVEELKREVAASLSAAGELALERAVLADVVAHLEVLKSCTARTPEDVKNVVSLRDLFELRIRVAVNGLEIRIYFTEMRDLPSDLVMLLAHVKQVDGSSDEISRLQDEHILRAARRWKEGLANRWGLRP